MKSTGEQVAVKIQKPNIRKQFNFDMFMHWAFLYFMEKSFDLPLTSFHDTLEENLRNEIDFRVEAQHAKKCKDNFTKVGRIDIHVPKIFDELTTNRTLVMEWIDGIKITDEERLVREGFDIP